MKDSNRKTDIEVGEFIRSMIKKAGLSQEALAEKLGVGPRSVAYYCAGKRHPTLRHMLMLIKLVGGVKAEDIPF